MAKREEREGTQALPYDIYIVEAHPCVRPTKPAG
jgi:hypothetical protein